MTFDQLQAANNFIKTTDIKGKDYAEVNQRIKAFRFLFPEGSITTDLISDDGERCVFRAIISDGTKVLGTGTAFEVKTSSFINKTSYIENCETSAVGRALAMCGIGIDTSIASYEEVANAIENQGGDSVKAPIIDEPKKTTKAKIQPKEEEQASTSEAYPDRDVMMEIIQAKYPKGTAVEKSLLDYFKVKSFDELKREQVIAVYNKCKG